MMRKPSNHETPIQTEDKPLPARHRAAAGQAVVHATSKPREPDWAARLAIDHLGVGVLLVHLDGGVAWRNATAGEWLRDGETVESIFAGAGFLEPFAGWGHTLTHVAEGRPSPEIICSLSMGDDARSSLFVLQCTPLPATRDETGSGVACLAAQCPLVLIRIHRPDDQDGLGQRLEVAQRLASLGKLAARVAHELNNPLDGILRYINLALRLASESPESKLRDYLSESRTGLMRMVGIIGDLLAFSRTTEGAFNEARIDEVVEQAIRSNAPAADAAHVVVAADFQSRDLPAIRGGRLYQVCCNLIKNAIDAMMDGGRLTVSTGLVGTDVVIRVADTGSGLPEDVDKVFEAFFTTKPAGQGTGLGLAICKDFIEDMQGTITASHGEEGGAVFVVRIPIRSCHQPSRLAGASMSLVSPSETSEPRNTPDEASP